MGKIREFAAKSGILVKIVHSMRDRKSIKKILEEKKKNNELKIIIGASGTNQNDWISTERETFDMLKPEKWLSVIEKHSIKYILAEHVFEHLTIEEGNYVIIYSFIGYKSITKNITLNKDIRLKISLKFLNGSPITDFSQT